MKKIALALALILAFSSPVFAGGSKAKYAPSVDPVALNDYYSALFQITPYCDATVGKITQTSQVTDPALYQAWSACYDCKREAVSIKFVGQIPSLQFDVDKYGSLCPN